MALYNSMLLNIELSLSMLNQNIPHLGNNVDPDQLTSEEAN